MEQFYLEKLTLRNYRRFSNKDVVLDQHMNVLIGSNASGKTTVLEAACVMLGAYLAAYKIVFPLVLYSIYQNGMCIESFRRLHSQMY